jgi:BolA protein
MIETELKARLEAALAPVRLIVHDDSALHHGHAGAQGGASHFRVEVVSAKFEGLSRVARHRLVYHSCADLMLARIHALAIVALTPTEAAHSKNSAQS